MIDDDARYQSIMRYRNQTDPVNSELGALDSDLKSRIRTVKTRIRKERTRNRLVRLLGSRPADRRFFFECDETDYVQNSDGILVWIIVGSKVRFSMNDQILL